MANEAKDYLRSWQRFSIEGSIERGLTGYSRKLKPLFHMRDFEYCVGAREVRGIVSF
jgi:hypothetical protein